MSAITGHLVRRGMELAAVHAADPEKKPQQISGALAALLAVTVLVFGFALWAVGLLFKILAMRENLH